MAEIYFGGAFGVFLGGLFPRPLPEGFPVVLGPLGTGPGLGDLLLAAISKVLIILNIVITWTALSERRVAIVAA